MLRALERPAAISISIQITLASGGVGWLVSRAPSSSPSSLQTFNECVCSTHKDSLNFKAHRIPPGLPGAGSYFQCPPWGDTACGRRMSAQHQGPNHPRWSLQSRHSSPLDALGPTQPESTLRSHGLWGKSWAHTQATSRPFLTTVSSSAEASGAEISCAHVVSAPGQVTNNWCSAPLSPSLCLSLPVCELRAS